MARGTLGPPIALPAAEKSTPQSSAVTLAAYRPDSARYTGRRSVSSGPLPGAHLWQSGGSPERRRRAAPARSPKLRHEDETPGNLHLPGLELQLGGSVVTAASVLAGGSSGKSAAAAAALELRVSQREQKLHHIQEKHDLALRRRAAAMGRHTIDHAEMFLSKEPPSLLARAPRSRRDRAEVLSVSGEAQPASPLPTASRTQMARRCPSARRKLSSSASTGSARLRRQRRPSAMAPMSPGADRGLSLGRDPGHRHAMAVCTAAARSMRHRRYAKPARDESARLGRRPAAWRVRQRRRWRVARAGWRVARCRSRWAILSGASPPSKAGLTASLRSWLRVWLPSERRTKMIPRLA